MSLLDALRSGSKGADKITKPFQGYVQYRRCTSKTGDGTKTLGGTVILRAIVDATRHQVRMNGLVQVVDATLEFIDVAAVQAATGGNGFSTDDEFILPDGKARQTLSAGGFMDAGTARPTNPRVILG